MTSKTEARTVDSLSIFRSPLKMLNSLKTLEKGGENKLIGFVCGTAWRKWWLLTGLDRKTTHPDGGTAVHHYASIKRLFTVELI